MSKDTPQNPGTLNLTPHRPPAIALQWVAIYTDNTELKQNYATKDEHHFGHIDMDRLDYFALEDVKGNRPYLVSPKRGQIGINGTPYNVKFPPTGDGTVPEYRLIYFRRVRNDIPMDGSAPTITVKHCIGLQATIKGQNYQQLVFVGEDGTIELAQVK